MFIRLQVFRCGGENEGYLPGFKARKAELFSARAFGARVVFVYLFELEACPKSAVFERVIMVIRVYNVTSTRSQTFRPREETEASFGVFPWIQVAKSRFRFCARVVSTFF